jgi:hypothetical protein
MVDEIELVRDRNVVAVIDFRDTKIYSTDSFGCGSRRGALQAVFGRALLA